MSFNMSSPASEQRKRVVVICVSPGKDEDFGSFLVIEEAKLMALANTADPRQHYTDLLMRSQNRRRLYDTEGNECTEGKDFIDACVVPHALVNTAGDVCVSELTIPSTQEVACCVPVRTSISRAHQTEHKVKKRKC